MKKILITLSFLFVAAYCLNINAQAVLEQQFSQKAPACTQVRRGDFVVRNLDWFQYDEGTVIVRLDANRDNGTLGSLQVCGGLRSGVEWEVFQSMYKYETKAWDWRTRGYSNQLEPATNPWWFTSHSSIWNLTAKTLIIDFEEKGTFKTTYPVL